MRKVALAHPADFRGWREKARSLLYENVLPEEVVWLAQSEPDDLFGSTVIDLSITGSTDESPAEYDGKANKPFSVPSAFLKLGEYVACHRDPNRFALLYCVLWRMKQGENNLLQNPCDDDVFRLDRLRRAVSRDRHKMTAFVRFRKLPVTHNQSDLPEREHYISWFEPDHHILRLTSDFFIKRFTNMNWSIYTPEESAHWNGSSIAFSEGGVKDSLPDAENMEELWRTYFANIYNPARLRIKAMQSEMPVKYWKNLPEASLIASLIHESGTRTSQMIERPATTAPKFASKAEYKVFDSDLLDKNVPAKSLQDLGSLIDQCRLCEHADSATQAVVGCFAAAEPDNERVQPSAKSEQPTLRSQDVVMLVGEQPGDKEDLIGLPFVGPAGTLLKEILGELQLDFDAIYFTNAVKHFNYTARGKRRIHQRPPEHAIRQCRPWIFEEIRLVKPTRIVALGITAAKALTGHGVKINEVRGQWAVGPDAIPLLITAHPSSVLRSSNYNARAEARQLLKQDLKRAFLSKEYAKDTQD